MIKAGRVTKDQYKILNSNKTKLQKGKSEFSH